MIMLVALLKKNSRLNWQHQLLPQAFMSFASHTLVNITTTFCSLPSKVTLFCELEMQVENSCNFSPLLSSNGIWGTACFILSDLLSD